MFVQKQFCFLTDKFNEQEPNFLDSCMPPEASIHLFPPLVAAQKTLKSALQFDYVDIEFPRVTIIEKPYHRANSSPFH
jgi:hypothetical protein